MFTQQIRRHYNRQGSFLLVTLRHRLTGIARTYFGGYQIGHPRHWTARFSQDRLGGEFTLK